MGGGASWLFVLDSFYHAKTGSQALYAGDYPQVWVTGEFVFAGERQHGSSNGNGSSAC